MKKFLIILFFFNCILHLNAQENSIPDFTWGNASYFNVNRGETIVFLGNEVELLEIENHYNRFRIEKDTFWIKVSRRTLPGVYRGLRFFVADNKNVKAITTDKKNHGLLKKDALICLSDFSDRLLNENQFVFPVSFNDGFIWRAEENSHMFSYLGLDAWKGKEYYRSHEGIDIDMHDARGLEKHLLVALENSRVVWIEDKGLDKANKEACILLESTSHQGVYYVYKHLYNKNVYVKEGQELVRGEPIGTIWGDQVWGHLHFAVVKSDTVPTYENRYHNLVNFFPQLYELYFQQTYNFARSFTRGKIDFGRRRDIHGNAKNLAAYEEYSGKGWIFGKWNVADKAEWIGEGIRGNARLRKTLFNGTKASAVNPKDYFDYEIKVSNGTYRIRSLMGDLKEASWQRVEFEGIDAGTFSLNAGELRWTNERVVKVKDGRLTVRIYINSEKNQYAGISQIVFQQAY